MYCREVRVEPNSVNVVALDEEPGDAHDRLMVRHSFSLVVFRVQLKQCVKTR